MPKLRLNLDPGEKLTFKREIAIPTPDGKGIKIEFVMKHRSREEMAEFTQFVREKGESLEESTAGIEAEAEGSHKLMEAAKAMVDSDVDSILDVAVDWNIDGYAFTRENIAKLCRLYPATAITVLRDYFEGMLRGRLGN